MHSSKKSQKQSQKQSRMTSDSPHDSAHLHVRGESEFVDDIPTLANEVFIEIVQFPIACGILKRLDFLKAAKTPGVIGIFVAEDLKNNYWGSIIADQPLLLEKRGTFVGEPVALIAASSRAAAFVGREKVRIEVQAEQAILSITEAKRSNSFLGSPRVIRRGEPESTLKAAPHRLKGKVTIRGAEHFYLENQSALAIPKEGGQIEVHCSSQHPSEVQHVVSHALGLSSNQVVVIVKRMGGAFGGKESQAAPFATYAALVAQRLKRPARISLSKDDDMIITGKRNPFENFYEVGFDKDGRILSLIAELYSDGGAYADLSPAIMERAMLHIDNAYFIPNINVRGQICRTNYHPHTAFRGFGAPKGVVTIERVIEEVAAFLGKDALDIRELNCYGDAPRNSTHYHQEFSGNNLPRLFSELTASCDYRKRRKEIADFNRQSLATDDQFLRGLSMTPVKFGISFTTRHLNQANALVHVLRDGTIHVSTGATEMGQGVNSRIAQIVASELGVQAEFVRLMPTSTERNTNTSPTAASSGTDLNGAAAVLATRKIKFRLSHIAQYLLATPPDRWPSKTAPLGTESEIPIPPTPEIKINKENSAAPEHYCGLNFTDGFVLDTAHPARKIQLSRLINEAYFSRISLSEFQHFNFSGLGFDKLKGSGHAFLYFTQGVAASEVEIERDTGMCKVRRADILMDLGIPINEALDLGQITGAFVQGMGWVTTEKLFYENGRLLSHSPSTYKIPSIQDTPREFNVRLFLNSENLVNVRATKAAGEPPLLLAISVWTAILDALKMLPQYREVLPDLELPATSEQILRHLDPLRFKRWETVP
jgi:xanthine dehydrogenase large subunit